MNSTAQTFQPCREAKIAQRLAVSPCFLNFAAGWRLASDFPSFRLIFLERSLLREEGLIFLVIAEGSSLLFHQVPILGLEM